MVIGFPYVKYLHNFRSQLNINFAITTRWKSILDYRATLNPRSISSRADDKRYSPLAGSASASTVSIVETLEAKREECSRRDNFLFKLDGKWRGKCGTARVGREASLTRERFQGRFRPPRVLRPVSRVSTNASFNWERPRTSEESVRGKMNLYLPFCEG